MSNPQKLDFVLNLIDKVTAPTSKVCKTLASVQKMANSGFDAMKNGAIGVGASWYSLTKMIDPARDYYKALGEVKSLDVTQEELNKLGASAMDYVQKYGGSVSDVIRSAYDIQSAIGGLGQGELAAFNNAANVTALATKATAADMTKYMGTMYGIFEKDAKNLGNAQWADQLMGKTALAVKMFKTTGPAMSAAFTNIGSDAQKMGISLNEQIGVLGTLQATMGGERAGSAYAAFVRAIPSAQGKHGINFKDTEGNAKPIFQIIDDLKSKFGHLDAISRADVIGQMFGSSEAVKVVNNLWDKTDGLKNSIGEIAKINDLGYAEKMAASMRDSLDKMGGAVSTLMLKISMAIKPTVDRISNGLSYLLISISEVIDKFPFISKAIGFVTVGVLGLSAAFAGVTFIAGAVKMAIGGFFTFVAYGIKVIKVLSFSLSWCQKMMGLLGLQTKFATIWQGISNALMQKGVFWASFQNMFLKTHTFLMSINTKTCFANTAATNAMSFAQIRALAWEKTCIIAKGVWNALLIAGKVIMLTAAIPALIAYATMLGVLKIGIFACQGAVWLFNAALMANPIVWVVAGIVALIAIIALCMVYWDEITAVTVACWDAMVSGLKWCWQMLKTFGEWIATTFTAYFNFWASGFSAIWEGLVTGATWCLHFLKPVFDHILMLFNSISGIWESVTGFFGGGETAVEQTLNKNINLEQNPALSSDRIRPDFSNTKSVSNQIQNKTNNFGGIKINVAGGFSPAQMAEWQALQC